MTPEQRKELVRKMWSSYMKKGADGLEEALTCLRDDATWTIPGSLPTSGSRRGKKLIADQFWEIREVFPDGFHIKFNHLHDTGEAVIAEMTIWGDNRKGLNYSNEYCVVNEVEGDLISHVRVYVDTAKAAPMFE